MQDGKIAPSGAAVSAPAGAVVIDGTGKYVTPGIIDDHSHIGANAAPDVWARTDANELVNPVTGVCVGRAFRVAAGPAVSRATSPAA